MDMGWVVQAGRKLDGAAVEDDPAADENHALNEPLDGAELVRDVDDRHAELLVELAQKGRERLLGIDVDPGRRLVENEKVRLACERLRDVGALLLSS
jgi:hypothetical protein